jgi:hypothetical protein
MSPTYIAFEGYRRIASGHLAQVAAKVKRVADRGEQAPVLIFDRLTSQTMEMDLRGTLDDVLARLPSEAAGSGPQPDAAEAADTPRGPGRPRLGVVAREVTLLPRHWEWLARQPGGASVALRKLVETARQANEGKDRARQAQEAAYRFMSVLAGNQPGYEEALRALYQGGQARFAELTEAWPADVRDHARELAGAAFGGETGAAQ